MDEGRPTREFRAEVSYPNEASRARARAALMRAVNAEAGVERCDISDRGRLVVLGLPAERFNKANRLAAALRHAARSTRVQLSWAAVAVVALGALAASNLNPIGSSGSNQNASLEHAILAAFDSSGGDVLHVSQTGYLAGKLVATSQDWTYPAREPKRGEQVESRGLGLDAHQTITTDVLFRYLEGAPGLPWKQKPGLSPTSGEVIDVDYASKTWSDQNEVPLMPAYPTLGDWLREQVATGTLQVEGRSSTNGASLIRLGWNDGSGMTTHTVWVSARTLLPVKSVFTYVAGSETHMTDGTIVSNYQYLQPTPGNLSYLGVPIPAQFTRVESPIMPCCG